MTPFIHIRIASVHADHLMLELPNQERLRWEIAPHEANAYQPGDELILTLTKTLDLLNELLATDNGEEKKR